MLFAKAVLRLYMPDAMQNDVSLNRNEMLTTGGKTWQTYYDSLRAKGFAIIVREVTALSLFIISYLRKVIGTSDIRMLCQYYLMVLLKMHNECGIRSTLRAGMLISALDNNLLTSILTLYSTLLEHFI